MRSTMPVPVRSSRTCRVPVLSLKYRKTPRPLPMSSAWGGREPVLSRGNRFPRHPTSMRAVNCAMDDLCHLQYTAGTTGKPKGAMLTHGNWMTALDAEREALRLRPDDVYLGIYPMGHVGLSWGLAVLRAGGTFVMMERFEPEHYLLLAEKYQVTVLAGMPPVIHSLVHSAPGTEDRLRTARLIISGGGQLLPAVWEAFDKRFHIPVANSYGLSETIVIGSGTTTLPEYPHLTRDTTRAWESRSGTRKSGSLTRTIRRPRCRPVRPGRSPFAGRPLHKGTGTCPRQPRRSFAMTAGS